MELFQTIDENLADIKSIAFSKNSEYLAISHHSEEQILLFRNQLSGSGNYNFTYFERIVIGGIADFATTL